MKLLVISHTPHFDNQGTLVGWGPTVRELDHLAQLFDELVHLAPLHTGPAPGSSLAYHAPNIRFSPVKPSGGAGWQEKLGILRNYPAYAQQILRELNGVEAVQVRCPANISLLALWLLVLGSRPDYRWVKYAGNWQPYPGEPWSYTVQRDVLRKNWHRGVVTINGSWPNQPGHVKTFPNPCLDQAEIQAGRQAAGGKGLFEPIELLFVGRIETAKGAGRCLEISELLRAAGLDFRLTLVGDGPERAGLQAWCRARSLDRQVQFTGWLPRPELARFYAKSHFLLLPSSASEGWPKVLSEAMAYGCVPLAGAVSSIPQILEGAGAGLALPPDQPPAYAQAVQDYLAAPGKWTAASQAGVNATPQFSYNQYTRQVSQLFAGAWGVNLELSG